MTESLKEIDCSPDCGFMVRSHKEEEVIHMSMKHVEEQHPDMHIGEEDMRSRMTEVPAV